MQPDDPRPRALGVPLLAAASLSLAFFASLRIAAAANDLWLDEIWVILQVAPFDSARAILTDLRQEHHLLYTFWIYALGPDAPALVYRLPAVACGVAAVPLAAAFAFEQARSAGRERAIAAAAFGLVLVGGCYFEIHYASEARGYAPAAALALAASLVLLRSLDSPRAGTRACYALFLCLALCAHPTALYALLAGLVWTPWHLRRHGASLRKLVRETLAWHAVPVAFLVLFYELYLSRLATIGGDELTPLYVLGRTVVYTLGLPSALRDAMALGIGAIALLAAGIALARAGSDLWLFYATLILFSPLALLWLRGSPYLYERYFLVPATFALILLADGLARLWCRGGAARVAACTAVALFAAGSAVQTAWLLRVGRGGYVALLERMAAESEGQRIDYGADHLFRIPMVLDFHARRALPDRELVLTPVEAGPTWLVLHRVEEMPESVPTWLDMAGHRYELRAVYPSAPLSGWTQILYRREADHASGAHAPAGAEPAR